MRRSPPSSPDQQYDSFGNIIAKNNVGTYTYDTTHPHRLTATSDGVSYAYDNVGNLTSDNTGRTLHYMVLDKPDSIVKLNNQITFAYGPDRNYYKRVDTVAGVTTTTYKIGNVEKVVKSDGSYDMKRYIAGVALWNHHFDSSGNETGVDKQYMYADVLGSVVLITDGTGGVKQESAFNAWGERVDATDWQTVLPATTFLPVSQQFTTHSFTGQDALDAVGLIDYGGRIYDPRIGRFIQADPFVQDAEDLQAYNRYAYVRNNPLTLTDPSGFSFLSKAWHHVTHAISNVWHAVKPYAQAIVVAVVSFYCAACGMALNAAWTAANGGSLSSSLISGVSAFAMSYIPGGGNFANMTIGEIAKEALISGIAGGTMSVLQGGKFGNGFVSAGIGYLAGGWGVKSPAGQFAMATVVGGTVSVMSGGKFANGAISAAAGWAAKYGAGKIQGWMQEAQRPAYQTPEYDPTNVGNMDGSPMSDSEKYALADNDSVASLAQQCRGGALGACTAAVNASGGDAMAQALGVFVGAPAAAGGLAAGAVVGAPIVGDAMYASETFGPAGKIFGRPYFGGNSIIGGNKYLRIGWGWNQNAAEGAGAPVFRMSGKLIEAIKDNGHIDVHYPSF